MSDRRWTLFANERPETELRFRNIFDHPRGVAFSDPSRPVIEVSAIADIDGDYMGWVEPQTGRLTMVQHQRIFDVQFPYGPSAAEAAGQGHAVRVRIEVAS